MKEVKFAFDITIHESAGLEHPFSGVNMQGQLSVWVEEDATEQEIEAACNMRAKEYFDSIISITTKQ